MLFVLSALFATFGSLHAEVTCPPDSIPGPDTCYKLGPAPMSWYMARHQCALLGGQLGVVDNAQVNNIVSQLAGSGSAKDYWTAAVHSDHWVWDPKDIPLTYTNWKQGSPQNDRGRCVAVDASGLWSSPWCSELRIPICSVSLRVRHVDPFAPGGKCDNGWELLAATNKCYKVAKAECNFNDAISECATEGGSLVTIPSAAANDAIVDFAARKSEKHVIMTGLTKLTGQWEWSDGRPLAYSNWAPYHPYEDGEGTLCAAFKTDSSNKAKWSTVTCSLGGFPRCAAMCEKDS
ncbi:Protein CLEC-49 [Aphelenchoides avenae]|nr:Protein CLEC-49 [Aphelenchus avenae]